GGLLENLYFRNINVGQVAHAVITIDFNYEEGEKGKFTPVVRNFVSITCKVEKANLRWTCRASRQLRYSMCNCRTAFLTMLNRLASLRMCRVWSCAMFASTARSSSAWENSHEAARIHSDAAC